MLLLGDCLDKLKEISDNSVDAVVTDPPYGLAFMNKKWDYDVPSVEIWREVYRVLKPGGHVLSFGGTRTYHRMVVNIEDAGFEIRDQVQWLYGAGFPKSMNLDRRRGIEFCGCEQTTKSSMRSLSGSDLSEAIDTQNKQGQVLQSSLSQQSTPCPVLWSESEKSTSFRKKSSMEGRDYLQTEQGELYRSEVREVSEGIFGDGTQGRLRNGASTCSGETRRSDIESNGSGSSQGSQHEKQQPTKSRAMALQSEPQAGRAWPTCPHCSKSIIPQGLGSALKPANEPICLARKPLEKGLTLAENVLKWNCGALNIDGCRVGPNPGYSYKNGPGGNSFSVGKGVDGTRTEPVESTQGRWPANLILDEYAASLMDVQTDDNVSRFFYVAKASKRERNAGLEGMPPVKSTSKQQNSKGRMENGEITNLRADEPKNQNFHPTVKPIRLMEYLCKLITPPNGTILDPFMGSGSTGVAAKNLGFNFIGCEMSPEYFEIAKKRISNDKHI